ncbi:MAG: LuxR C-terminal-related transcriptional regulator [Coriobacteriia bacterium]
MGTDKTLPKRPPISRPFAGLPPFKPSYLGYGVYWAWVFLSFNSAVLVPEAKNASAIVLRTHQISIAVALVMLIGMILSARRISPLKPRRATLFGLTALACAGSTAIALAGAGVLGGEWIAIGSALTGIGTMWLALSWGERYGSIGAESATVHTVASMVLASALYFAVLSLPMVLAQGATVLLLLVSAVLLLPNGESVPAASEMAGPTWRHLRSSLSWRVIAGIAIIAIAMGVMLRLTAHPETASFESIGRLGILANGAFILLLGLGSVLFRGGMNLGFAYRLALPLIAIGFLALALLGRADLRLSSVAVSAGVSIFEVLTWIVLADVTYRSRLSAVRVFGLGRFALQAGMLVGELLGGFFFTRLTPLALVMLFVLLIVALYVLNERNIFDVGTHEGLEKASAGDETDWAGRLARITAEYGLSPREHEILGVWAKGRSIEHVEEKFHISKNTAKTHLAHIYQKTGVHTREELLTLIERTAPMRTNGAERQGR